MRTICQRQTQLLLGHCQSCTLMNMVSSTNHPFGPALILLPNVNSEKASITVFVSGLVILPVAAAESFSTFKVVTHCKFDLAYKVTNSYKKLNYSNYCAYNTVAGPRGSMAS